MKLLSWHSGLLALAISCGMAVQAQSINLFKDVDFQGPSQSYGTPERFLSRDNDEASSMILDGTWDICRDANFQNCTRYGPGSYRNLQRLGLNDNISSVRPVSGGYNDSNYGNQSYQNRYNGNNAVGRQTIILYKDVDFQGPSQSYGTPEQFLTRDNDEASSMILKGSWEVCRDADFRNCTRYAPGSYSDLQRLGLNDNISSVRPISGGYNNNGNRNNNSDNYNAYNSDIFPRNVRINRDVDIYNFRGQVVDTARPGDEIVLLATTIVNGTRYFTISYQGRPGLARVNRNLQ